MQAGDGWTNLKKLHGIRRLKMAGEKLKNDEAVIGPFQLELQKVIREKKLTAEHLMLNSTLIFYIFYITEASRPKKNTRRLHLRDNEKILKNKIVSLKIKLSKMKNKVKKQISDIKSEKS